MTFSGNGSLFTGRYEPQNDSDEQNADVQDFQHHRFLPVGSKRRVQLLVA